MADTPRLSLPEIIVSQSQKEVTFAECLRILDALVQAVIQDKDLTSSPVGVHGNCWIVGGTGGYWSGANIGQIAQYYNSAWYFITPWEGLRVYVLDENIDYRFDGAAWDDLT